jgi:hypothetical protein
MDVQLGTDEHGNSRPVSFRAGSYQYTVEEHLDTWYGGTDYTWYKVRANDGNLYILRIHGTRWTLDSFRQTHEETSGTRSV